MKFAIAVSLLFSLSAFAGDGFDCRTAGSPQGGKFCHYRISQCERSDCFEAAQCAVEEYSHQVAWDDIESVKVVSLNPIENTLTFSVKNKNGVEKEVVTFEAVGETCRPVALTKI